MKVQTEKNQTMETEESIKNGLEIIHSLNDLLYSSSLF
ncbi:hypothetical protein AB996_2108 [Lactococcus cremoris]|uniref:Uncharacterized protein n=1 Tax=Lactococcus lactis subsp. cremoris TaxID=1359 RepID=A0A166IVW0_LACLC|nr:hypothetical protein AB996_2108 [Lactococcus cremoris]